MNHFNNDCNSFEKSSENICLCKTKEMFTCFSFDFDRCVIFRLNSDFFVLFHQEKLSTIIDIQFHFQKKQTKLVAFSFLFVYLSIDEQQSYNDSHKTTMKLTYPSSISNWDKTCSMCSVIFNSVNTKEKQHWRMLFFV